MNKNISFYKLQLVLFNLNLILHQTPLNVEGYGEQKDKVFKFIIRTVFYT